MEASVKTAFRGDPGAVGGLAAPPYPPKICNSLTTNGLDLFLMCN